MILSRRVSRQVFVGPVPVGGTAPLAVQTMTKAPADDVEGTLRQIHEAAGLGCDIIRCAIPTLKQIPAFAEVAARSPLPVVADIHFDCRIALEAIRAGAKKIRINPGNMADWDGLKEIAAEAKRRHIPIRIGVNSGSVKHKSGDGDARPVAEALAEEALSYVECFENMGFRDLVISVKAADAADTVAANREVARRCDYPLHLGVTAAGPEEESLLKSAVAIGALLMDGIGDTLRLSFTGPPAREVIAARQLLRAAGLLKDGPDLLSCPTCGRCKVDLVSLVREVKTRLREVKSPLTVAVMGCEVNGPGEAKGADVGIASAGGTMVLFVGGEKIRSVPADQAVDVLMEEVNRLARERPA